MFGAGWTEMLIIGIVALVVIGPKDLPIVMRKVGRVVSTIRRMGSEFQREINKTTGLDQITDLRRSITEPLRQTSEDIAKEFNRMTPTGVEPTGIMKPLDPKVESVYEQIAATSGVTTPAATAAAPAAPIVSAAEAAILPGPAEAAVASKPRRPAKPKPAAEAAPALIEKPAKKAAAKPAAKAAVATSASSDAPAPAKVNAPPEAIAAAKPVAARKPSTAKVAAVVSSATVAAAAAPAPVKAARTRAKKA